MSDETTRQPDWADGLPVCTEVCPKFDGKRCKETGFRPDRLCEPEVRAVFERFAPVEDENATLTARVASLEAEVKRLQRSLEGAGELYGQAVYAGEYWVGRADRFERCLKHILDGKEIRSLSRARALIKVALALAPSAPTSGQGAAATLEPCPECGAKWVVFAGGDDAGMVHAPGCSRAPAPAAQPGTETWCCTWCDVTGTTPRKEGP